MADRPPNKFDPATPSARRAEQLCRSLRLNNMGHRIDRIPVATRITFLVILLYLTGSVTSKDSDLSSIGRGKALERALEYSGFESSSTFSVFSIELPFTTSYLKVGIHESLNVTGHMREVWHFRFLGIKLHSKEVETAAQAIDVRDFDVYIDDRSGQLIKIVSDYSDLGRGFERDFWSGLLGGYPHAKGESLPTASMMPRRSFLQALREETLISWSYSNQIEAYWISREGSDDTLDDSVAAASSQPRWRLISRHLGSFTKNLGRGRSAKKYYPMLSYVTLDVSADTVKGIVVSTYRKTRDMPLFYKF